MTTQPTPERFKCPECERESTRVMLNVFCPFCSPTQPKGRSVCNPCFDGEHDKCVDQRCSYSLSPASGGPEGHFVGAPRQPSPPQEESWEKEYWNRWSYASFTWNGDHATGKQFAEQTRHDIFAFIRLLLQDREAMVYTAAEWEGYQRGYVTGKKVSYQEGYEAGKASFDRNGEKAAFENGKAEGIKEADRHILEALKKGYAQGAQEKVEEIREWAEKAKVYYDEKDERDSVPLISKLDLLSSLNQDQ